MYSKKVLVVTGDVASSRRTFEPMLLGHDLVFARDALETLASMAQHRDVDVVLVDLGASRRNGADVIVRLASHPLTTHVPLLIAGADDTLLRSVKHARAGRATAYLTPPFRKDDLLEALHGLLTSPASRGLAPR